MDRNNDSNQNNSKKRETMKKLIILCCLLIPLCALGQNTYVIYNCADGVQVFDTISKTWRSTFVGEKITSETSINLPDKTCVQILDTKTNRIYSNAKGGKTTISDVIDKATKMANSSFANLNKQIAKNISKQQKGVGYSTYGVTTRGLEEGITLSDSLYCSLYSCIVENTNSDLVQFKMINMSDNTVSFEIINTSNIQMYISILFGNKDSLSICLGNDLSEFGVIQIPPQTSMDLSSYCFVKPSGDQQYYLVTSSKAYSLEPIKSRIKYMREPDYILEERIVNTTKAE